MEQAAAIDMNQDVIKRVKGQVKAKVDLVNIKRSNKSRFGRPNNKGKH